MKELIKKLFKTGFFSIYISTILTKVILLFGGVLVVRILDIKDYGIYTLVNNAFSMLNILGDFGISTAILVFLVDKQNDLKKRNLYLIFGVKYGIIAGLISGIIILISPMFYPYKNSIVSKYTQVLFLIPLITIFINIISSLFRTNDDNKKYSWYQIIYVSLHYAVIIIFCLLFGLKGSILSQYIYTILTLIVGFILVRKYFSFKKEKSQLTKDEKINFIKYSLSAQFANLTSSLLYSVDIFIIGLMIINIEELSLYKVSTVIPNALAFLPSCLMVYLLPIYIRNRKNTQWLKNNTKKLIKIGFVVYFGIFIISVLFSKYIFLILYGKEYVNAMYPFIILMIGFVFNATFKVPLGNIFTGLKCIKYNIFINIICLISNAILNYTFINIFGYIGAAMTTTIVMIISSILYLIIFRKVLRENEKNNLNYK